MILQVRTRNISSKPSNPPSLFAPQTMASELPKATCGVVTSGFSNVVERWFSTWRLFISLGIQSPAVSGMYHHLPSANYQCWRPDDLVVNHPYRDPLSEDDWGVKSNPKCIIFRFHETILSFKLSQDPCFFELRSWSMTGTSKTMSKFLSGTKSIKHYQQHV